MLAYQAVYHGTLTPVYPTIFKVKTVTYPDEPGLIEALSSPQSEQWNKAITKEITNLVNGGPGMYFRNMKYLREPI